MSVIEEYLAEAGGNKVKASVALCRGLMRHDPSDPLRQGYTIGNALIAAIDAYNLTTYEVALVADAIVEGTG
jgi:hypothetical protein